MYYGIIISARLFICVSFSILLYMKDKNITLGYILAALNNLFFWYAPWLLYFLNYIDFSQVAIVLAVGIITSVVTEVPTGAIADLIGKKKTLVLSFLFTSVGELLTAFYPSFSTFIIASIIINTGYSLYSGTMEAYLYDTLVGEGRGKDYGRVLSRSSAVVSAAIAFACIAGGFMYKWWMILPWIVTGIIKFVGFVLTFFIDEPKVDTEKFSLKNFLVQTRRGFVHLFNRKMLQITILLITFGAFYTIAYELLDDISVVSFGYTAVGIGLLYGILYILKIPFGLLYEKVSGRYKPYLLIALGALVIILNYIFSPWISVYTWTGLFLVRIMYGPIRTNAITEIINRNTPSKIRATTISTNELLRKIPFVFLAGFLGKLIDIYGAKIFAFWFALLFLIFIVPQFVVYRWKRKREFL